MEVTTSERYASGPPGAEMVAPNLAKAFQATVEKMGDAPALVSGDETVSWNEVRRQARAYAGGFASLGVGKGDTVALMLNNRTEFMPIDLGAVTLGAVPFSIYQTSSPEQITYVCSDAERKGGRRREGVPRGLRQGPGRPARRSST